MHCIWNLKSRPFKPAMGLGSARGGCGPKTWRVLGVCKNITGTSAKPMCDQKSAVLHIQLHWMAKWFTRRAARLVSDFAIRCSCICSPHAKTYITSSVRAVFVRGPGSLTPAQRGNPLKDTIIASGRLNLHPNCSRHVPRLFVGTELGLYHAVSALRTPVFAFGPHTVQTLTPC